LTGHVSFVEASGASLPLLPDEATPLAGLVPSRNFRRDGVHNLRVGVFFSHEAFSEYGAVANISALVSSAANTMAREVLPGSGLAATVNFSLCFSEPLPVPADFAERASPGDTLRAFSALPLASQHRECTNFVLFSTLRGLGYRACGIGFLPGTTAVVAGICFDENLSFAHELGHNVAMTHREGFASEDGRFRSIMAYRSLCKGKTPCDRVPRYSSLGGTWHGVSIGSVSSNNAQNLL